MADEKEINLNLKTVGMDIYRAQRLAEDRGFDSCTMTCIGPNGLFYGKWLDAYFGFFKPEKADGFVTVDQLAQAGYRCLTLFAPDGEPISEDNP